MSYFNIPYLAGKVAVLKCLLDIYKIFRAEDPFYLLNQLYIEEYCVWIQKISPEMLKDFASVVEMVCKLSVLFIFMYTSCHI